MVKLNAKHENLYYDVIPIYDCKNSACRLQPSDRNIEKVTRLQSNGTLYLQSVR